MSDDIYEDHVLRINLKKDNKLPKDLIKRLENIYGITEVYGKKFHVFRPYKNTSRSSILFILERYYINYHDKNLYFDVEIIYD